MAALSRVLELDRPSFAGVAGAYSSSSKDILETSGIWKGAERGTRAISDIRLQQQNQSSNYQGFWGFANVTLMRSNATMTNDGFR